MLRLPLPCLTGRTPSWPATLLACVLSVLLLAAVHCSSYLAGDGHQHVSLSAPTGHEESLDRPEQPERPVHDHGSACVSPCPTTWAWGAAHRLADANAGLPSVEPCALPAEHAGAHALHGTGRSSIARTGRSTLAGVCRWRI